MQNIHIREYMREYDAPGRYLDALYTGTKMTQPYFFDLTPVSKPRMTISDRWKKRPCVLKYFDYKNKLIDSITKRGIDLEWVRFLEIIFFIEMPKSWSNKKKLAMNNEPHDQRPDIDNLQKAILDAIFEEDKKIFWVVCQKFWTRHNPGIYIKFGKKIL